MQTLLDIEYTRERDLVKAIEARYAGDERILITRTNNVGGQYQRKDGSAGWIKASMKGWPDFCGLLRNGRFIGVEAKAAGKGLSPHQKDVKALVDEKNGVYVHCHSVNDVERAIQEALA